MKMYEVRLQVNDDRPEALVMREVYLDFYSKSLFLQQSKPETCSYSKRLQEEQKEHKEILDKIVMGQDPKTFKDDYDLKNGDPSIDPRLEIERKMSIKQQKLMGTYQEEPKKDDEKFKLSLDGLYVEENDDKPDSFRTDEDLKNEGDDEKIADQIL